METVPSFRLERFLRNIAKDVEGLQNTEIIVARYKLDVYKKRGIERNIENVIRKLGAAGTLISPIF